MVSSGSGVQYVRKVVTCGTKKTNIYFCRRQTADKSCSLFIVFCDLPELNVVICNAGNMPFADGAPQFTPGPVGHPPTAVPPVTPGMLGMPDLTYNPVLDTRSPVPSAPVPLSSLPVNLSSPPQPPLYQPSPLPAGTVPGTSAPSDTTSGIGGPPPPPPTGGFVPSHGIVTATPGKVSHPHLFV